MALTLNGKRTGRAARRDWVEGSLDLLTISDKDGRDKKLKQIKVKMEELGPTCGNFYIWYHEVYQLRSKNIAMYRQAIDQKYKGLGLNESEQ